MKIFRHLLLTISAVAALFVVCSALNVGTIIWENGVILRSEAAITAEPLRIAQQDDTIIILDQIQNAEGSWYCVKYNLLSGYMRADLSYIKVETAEEANSRDLGRGMSITNCNLRAAPRADAPVVYTIIANTQLEVIGLSEDWFHILLISGDTYYEGYIHSDLICLTEVPISNSSGLLSTSSDSRAAHAIEIAKQFLGTPYVFGAKDPEVGFDCSGLVQYVADQLGLNIERTAQRQAAYGITIPFEQLQIGDLVFFINTYSCPDLITHVGFYVGGGQFLHAGGDHVQISNLSHPYYASRFFTARRFF